MGQFSWLDCKDNSQILDDVKEDVYVLIPREFGGGHILESHYDGYGDFGGYDIYDLVADWNKNYLSVSNLIPPERDSWIGPDAEKYYQRAVWEFVAKCEKLEDFKVLSDAEMKEKYGEDYKRIIGIEIACYDSQIPYLRYPIKITHDKFHQYEYCAPSISDPNQGWPVGYEDDEDYDEWEDEDDYEDE